VDRRRQGEKSKRWGKGSGGVKGNGRIEVHGKYSSLKDKTTVEITLQRTEERRRERDTKRWEKRIR
jgi:hypothetical protein